MSAVAKPDYTYWQNALKGEFGPVHDEPCHPGFWRRRVSRGGGFVPVAVWYDPDGVLVALVNGNNPVESDGSLWSYICRYPVTEEAYRQRVRTGRWPDEDGAVAASLEPPPMGDNNPPTDEIEILKGQIEAAAAGADAYAEITDDESAAKAQSLRSRLLELSGEADKKRTAEKAPHLEAGKAIDAKWQPLVKSAKSVADMLRAALGAHETRKARAAAEAEAKRRQAEQEAERKRLAAEAAGKPVPPTPDPVPVEPAPQPVAAIRGAYGRAAAVKAVKVARVVDQDAAYSGLKTHKEMIDLIARLAQRAAEAGISLPGVEVTEERKVS